MVNSLVKKIIEEAEIGDYIWNYYYSFFKPGWHMTQAHSHGAIEIVYVIDGVAYYRFGKEAVKIVKNNVLLIPPNVPHKLYVEYDCTLMQVALDFNRMLKSQPGQKLEEALFSGLLHGDMAYLKIADDSSIKESMRVIVFEMAKKEDNYELMVKIETGKLLVSLLRMIKRMRHADIQSEHISRAIHYIVLSLANELSPEIISDAVHISCDHLKHIFKQYTGYSVMQYVTKKRLDLSMQLLRETDKKISDIAMDVGIANFAHFSTLFKKNTGTSPSQYRRQNRIRNYGDSRFGTAFGESGD